MLLFALMAPWAANAQTRETQTFDFEDQTIPSTWTNDATYPWVVTDAAANGGTYSIKSGNAGENSTTSSITATFTFLSEGTISFAARCSCEQTNPSYDWDYGTFYIDGEQQGAKIINSDDFSSYNYDVDAGEHTFMWKYKKDSSVGSNDDCLYVDDIVVNLGTVGALNKPTNLAYELTPGNGTVATLSWQQVGTVTGWQIMLNNNESNLINVSTNPYMLTGLTPETTYTACVRATDGNNVSAWSSSVTFTPTNAYMFTVNDGTTTNAYVPVFGYWSDSQQRSEFIIPASTLSSLNGTNLTSMKFYANYNFTSTGTFYAYLMEVSEEAFSGTDFYTEEEATIVYQGTITVSSTDGMTINFPENGFDYNGGNLLVGFYKASGGNYSNLSSDAFYGVSATGASISYYSSNATAQRNFLPKVTFSFNPTQSSCKKPTNVTVSDITGHEATVTWTENGEATAWIVRIGRDEYEVSTTSYTITGLNAQTQYSVQVRPVCTDADDKWSDEVPFTTDITCPAPTLSVTDITTNSAVINWAGNGNYELRYGAVPETRATLYYDFEDGLGEWTTIDGDGDGFTWTALSNITSVTTSYSSTAWAYNDSDDAIFSGSYVNGASVTSDPDNLLVSPQVTLGGSISFYARNLQDAYPEHIGVAVSTGSNTNVNDFVVVDEWDIDEDDVYHLYTVDLSAYSGPGYIAIRNFNVHDMYIVIIDDVTIEEGSLVEPEWGETITGVTSPYSLTDLDDDTRYMVQVRANCGAEGYSEWAQIAFRTHGLCDLPTTLDAEAGATSATLTWEGYQENGYNLQWRTAESQEVYYFDDLNGSNSISSWWSQYDYETLVYFTSGDNIAMIGYGTTDTQYLISGELPEIANGSIVQFDQRLYNYQSESTSTSFRVGYSSTTADVSAFTFGNVVNVTSTSFAPYSEEIPAGTKYIAIESTGGDDFGLMVDNFGIYGPVVAAGTWNPVNGLTDTSYDLTGLEPEKEYEWQVQGVNCDGNGNNTEWAEIATFTTTAPCVVPENFAIELDGDNAILTWESDAASFVVEVNFVEIEGITSPTYTFEVEPETIYYVRVKANCGDDGYSEWTDYKAFVGACDGPKELPYEFGFENQGEYYACWTELSANENNYYGLTEVVEDFGIAAYEGDMAFVFSSYNSADSYIQALISPELSNEEDEVLVSFQYKVLGSGTESVYVCYSITTDDISAFEVFDELEATSADEWTEYTATLPAGTKYVMLYYFSSYQYYLLIDSFLFEKAAGSAQTVELTEGWNWFSSYIAYDDPVDMLDALKESLGENADQILSANDNTEFDGEEWFGGLDDSGITNEEMVMILANTACTVELEGTPANPADYEITINPGWNWIGFPSAEELDVMEALADFPAAEGDLIVSQEDQTEFDGEEWFGFETFVPGQGLMYYSVSEDEKTLVFQTGAKARRANTVLPSISLNKMNKIVKNGVRPTFKLNKTKGQQARSLRRPTDKCKE